MLQHSDVRSVIEFAWHKFEGQVSFPLPVAEETSEDRAEKVETIAE